VDSGAADHGDLTGLNDDDHLQYHTDARGDARYSLTGHTHSGVYDPAGTAAGAVSTHESTYTHSSFLTSETDPVFTAWDKSTGISITESQISDLGTYEPADATILKSAAIGVTVQGYSANTIIGDGSILSVIALTQAEYDALTPAATTLYVITDA
jgi:hypothetical protein